MSHQSVEHIHTCYISNEQRTHPHNILTQFKSQALARSLVPLADRVLVRRAAKEVQTAGGIYLPTDTTKEPNSGEVVSVGPGMRDISGGLHPPTLKAGDSVLLPEYGGTKIEVNDEEMFLFRADDILGKFE